GAPRYKLVATSIVHPTWGSAELILPEAKDPMQYIVKGNDYLLAVYSNGIVGRVVSYRFSDGTTTEIQLPISGSVNVSCPDRRTNRFLFTISSWTLPTAWYDYDAGKGSFTKSMFNSDVTYPG